MIFNTDNMTKEILSSEKLPLELLSLKLSEHLIHIGAKTYFDNTACPGTSIIWITNFSLKKGDKKIHFFSCYSDGDDFPSVYIADEVKFSDVGELEDFAARKSGFESVFLPKDAQSRSKCLPKIIEVIKTQNKTIIN